MYIVTTSVDPRAPINLRRLAFPGRTFNIDGHRVIPIGSAL